MKGHSVFAKRMIRGGKICNYMGEVCTYSMFIIITVVVEVIFLNLNTRRNAGQLMLLRRIPLSII